MKDIKEIIKNNEIKELSYSILNKDSIFKDLCNSKYYYLIFAIESNCTIEMIKFIITIFFKS